MQNHSRRHPLVTVSDSVAVPFAVEAILFDAGDILYDATAWWRWVVKLLARFDVQTQFDASYHVWQREYLQQTRLGCTDYWAAFSMFLRSVGMRPSQIREALAASRPRYRLLHDQIRPLPEVTTTLAKLAATGTRLGVANHTVLNNDAMWNRLGDAGLDRYFDFVATTGEMELLLPTASFYGKAAGEFTDHVERVVFVGHDFEELSSAKEAGLTTVACNHRVGLDVDIAVDRFARLVEVIRPLRSLRAAG